jgi:hypothetical protein
MQIKLLEINSVDFHITGQLDHIFCILQILKKKSGYNDAVQLLLYRLQESL